MYIYIYIDNVLTSHDRQGSRELPVRSLPEVGGRPDAHAGAAGLRADHSLTHRRQTTRRWHWRRGS